MMTYQSNSLLMTKDLHVSSARDTSYNPGLPASLAHFYPTVFTQTYSSDFILAKGKAADKSVDAHTGTKTRKQSTEDIQKPKGVLKSTEPVEPEKKPVGITGGTQVDNESDSDEESELSGSTKAVDVEVPVEKTAEKPDSSVTQFMKAESFHELQSDESGTLDSVAGIEDHEEENDEYDQSKGPKSSESKESQDSPPLVSDYFVESSDDTIISQLDKQPSLTGTPSLERQIQRVNVTLEKFRNPNKERVALRQANSLQELASTLEETLAEKQKHPEKKIELQETTSDSGNSRSMISDYSDELIRCCRFRKKKDLPASKKPSAESIFRKNLNIETRTSGIINLSHTSDEEIQSPFAANMGSVSEVSAENFDDYYSFGVVRSMTRHGPPPKLVSDSRSNVARPTDSRSTMSRSNSIKIVRSLQTFRDDPKKK